MKTWTWRSVAVVILVGFMAAACGGGSKSTGPSGTPSSASPGRGEAPVITRVEWAQVISGGSRVTGARLEYHDEDGDVFGGWCRVLSTGGNLEIPIDKLLPGASPDQRDGFIICAVARPASSPPQTISGTLSLVDRAGHESNRVSFTVAVEEARSPHAGRGTPIESGSVGGH